jgi:anti-sigma factor RsiW
MSDRDEKAIPDVLLERYRLGEMSPGQRDALQQRLATDPEGAERLAQLESSDRDIETRHPAD